MGEREPRSDYSITHGICPICHTRSRLERNGLVSGARLMFQFFESIREDLLALKNRPPAQLLADAEKIGIAPLDLVAGIMQPVLYEIARLQGLGEATIEQEHRFSELVEGLLDEMKKRRPHDGRLLSAGHSDVVLACHESNLHVIGVRLINEYLLSKGISTQSLFPRYPFKEIIDAANESRAKIVGISVANEEQALETLNRWTQYVQSHQSSPSLHLLLGGMGVSSILPPLPARTYISSGSLQELEELAGFLLANQAA